MSKDKSMMPIKVINKMFLFMAEQIKDLGEIKTDDDWKHAEDLCASGRVLTKDIEAERKIKTEPLYKSQLEIKAEYDDLKNRVFEIIRPLEVKVQAYLRIQSEARQKAEAEESQRQAKIREEQLEIERKRVETLEKARIAREQAKKSEKEVTEKQKQETTKELEVLQAEKENLLQQSQPVELPKKVSGSMTTRTNVSGEVYDMGLLIKAVAGGYVNAGVLKVNQPGINNYIKLQKDVEGLFDFEVLKGYGIKVIEKEILVSNPRSRRSRRF